MKSIIVICVLSGFVAGCARKETAPITITVDPKGHFQVDSKSMSSADLEKHIANLSREKGSTLKIVFVANKKTRFSVVEPAVLLVAKMRAWWFVFKESDGPIIEECVPNLTIGDGPPKLDLKMEIKDDRFFLDGRELSIAELKKLFAKRPKKDWGYLVSISCLGETTFGRFCELLKLCREYRYVSVNLNVMDKLYP